MAGMEREFRDGFAAQPADADVASEAAEMLPDDGDMTCPCCGASAMKIAQAAQGGQAPAGGLR